MSLDVYNRSGEVVRKQDIPAAFSNTDIDPGVVHQCIVAYLANQRRGTASTKTRGKLKVVAENYTDRKGQVVLELGMQNLPYVFTVV